MPSIDQISDNFVPTGDIATDATAFLQAHNFPKTAAHVADVAQEAGRLAQRFGADIERAQIAGWLHDISVIIPNNERIVTAQMWNVPVLPEEATFPMIIHQKLSVVMARDIFGIQDEAILSAIGCHTTLKRHASLLDKIVYVADKIAWDQPGKPPYFEAITEAAAQSIDKAAYVYASYLWDMRDQLRVLHPWARDAYEDLK